MALNFCPRCLSDEKDVRSYVKANPDDVTQQRQKDQTHIPCPYLWHDEKEPNE